MSISVIIPTLGRPTLDLAVASAIDADEVVVVADALRADTDHARAVSETFGAEYVEIEMNQPGIGAAERAAGVLASSGTHLAFLDDDDTYTLGALAAMRQWACDGPVLFRMLRRDLGLLWKRPEVVYGNVGMPMIVVPRDFARLGHFTPMPDGHGCDFGFIKSCVEKMGEPLWREEVVCICGPEGSR